MNIIFGIFHSLTDSICFFKSLRKYTDCKVVIVCEKQISQELIDLSVEMDFEIFSDFTLDYQMTFYKFEIYNNYLKNTDMIFNKVLLVDNVIFQEDPFKIYFTEEIYCAVEQSILSENDCNMRWIGECSHVPGNNYNNYKNKHAVSSKVILGTYTGIMKYLDFYKHIQSKKVVNDQGLLNVYVYNYLHSKKCLGYKESKILTTDKSQFDTVNNKGEKYSIIHKTRYIDFYLSITTIKKYKPALDMLLNSLPDEWKNKYILVYQNEDENYFQTFEDGHIEVYITNNLSDYGNFVGVNILLEANIIPQTSWFLFVHDTCKFLENCVGLTNNLIKYYNDTETDILWLSNTGQCNICLIRKNAITLGNNLYKDIMFMSKIETIKYEWEHTNPLSPKSLCVKQCFLNVPTKHLGKRFVYNNTNERDCLLYESINMEKYYFHTNIESDHPFSP